MVMLALRKKFGLGLVCGWLATAMPLVALAASAAISAAAQTPEKTTGDHNDHPVDRYYEPLPQDTGAAGLKLMLRRLQTTARLMQVDAHPDDEDGGMLTLEARGKGVSTLLMTLNRGEGGQNKLGSNLFDVLGVLRTLEVLASDRYYGVEQRFSRVADFGYSKTAEETFQKWQGHDIALADIVRVVRTFRPDVLVARFSGTDRDGHGHHQASAILTKEAFRAAADPKRFPEQIQEGLEPWQPKKLYIGNVCGFMATTCDAANYTLRLNTGVVDPVLGTSYVQFAMKGLRHQQSQGAANWTVEPGDRFTYYKLVDSVVESLKDLKDKDKDGHEQSFFDGIDTTLPGLASRLGDEEKKVPWLRGALEGLQKKIDEAAAAAEKDPSLAVKPLDEAGGTALGIAMRLPAELSAAAKASLVFSLANESSKLQVAAQHARGMRLDVTADGISPDEEHAFLAVPGQIFRVRATATSKYPWQGRANITLLGIPGDWKIERIKEDSTNGEAVAEFQVRVPNDIPYTRPYWHRLNPETDAINTIDDVECNQCATSTPLPYVGAWWHSLTLPFSTLPSMEATAHLGYEGTTPPAAWMVKYKDEHGNVAERPLAVVPEFSVALEPGEQVVPGNDRKELTVKVGVRSSAEGVPDGMLRLELPAGWRYEPRELPIHLPGRDDRKDFLFKIFPTSLKEGRIEVHAVLEAGGKRYAQGYTLVTREDLGAAYYYQPAAQHVSVVDVKVPKDLKVGYVMGAGDEIPTVLEQIGMDVTQIPAEKLSTEDLSRYQTIVLGIRAYDTQKDVKANNQRLLDFVQAGGRLVVQYNTTVGDFNSGKFTPYPATLSRARVSVEEAPVAILDAANPTFHSPNEITQKDFEGWVQERGLYFMSQWDSNFTPLLESHDPGEGEQKGGLLLAHYGKGTYIYTGYAFFRQLPAGVPGAVRLFVNLIGSR
jgi:LmbE family N-acetylglucosaminyl deacetylase